MKKIVLAVILVAATGGITYYLLQKKNQIANADFKKEQIIGKWKMDSLDFKSDSASLLAGIMGMIDSNLLKYDYDFQKGGMIVKFLKDSVQKDTAKYEWTKDNRVLWKEQGDPTGERLTVNVLNKDSLVLSIDDSTIIYFRRVNEDD